MERLKDRAINAKILAHAEAERLYQAGLARPFRLMACASEMKGTFQGKKVNLCSIVNAKSGLCAENWQVLLPAAHYCTDARQYPFMERCDHRQGKAGEGGRGAHVRRHYDGTRIVAKRSGMRFMGP